MLLSSRPFFAQRVAIWLTWMRVTFRTRPLDSKGSPSDSRRTSSANSSSVTRVGMEAFFRASGAAWSEHLRARQKACMSVRRLASHTGRRGEPRWQSRRTFHTAGTARRCSRRTGTAPRRAERASPREPASRDDGRACGRGSACAIQRRGVQPPAASQRRREWVRVFAALSRWSQSVPRCSHSESMSIPVTATEFGHFGIGGDASTKAVAIETAGSIKNLPEV